MSQNLASSGGSAAKHSRPKLKARFNVVSLLRNALSNHEDWPRQWRSPEPKPEYDVIIIGAGGHGLATAYYLAKNHGITNVCVLEKGWLGGGNTGRNTTIIRSNYLWDESAALYQHALDLWPGLSKELNYNIMYSQRGVMNLAHNEHDMKELQRRVNANWLNGVESEFLDPQAVKKFCPAIDLRGNGRYPVMGATLQRKAGTARHDAVAWGYARGADAYGIDIVQNCAVTGFDIDNGVVKGVQTTRGPIRAKRVGLCVAGHTPKMAELAGLQIPTQSTPLQALVSEPLKPAINCVVMSNAVHAYISQSDKGELVIGAGTDQYVSYGQRGSMHVTEETLAAICELFPQFSRVKMMRSWGGIVDTNPDASPIIGKTPVEGLFLNCGWGTGGFKGTPASGWTYAHTLATGEPHKLNEGFSLKRFETGYLIDEHGAAAVAH